LFKEILHDALTADGGRGSLAAMYLGLDGFKPINDGLGRPVGDRILITIAQRLTDLMGPEATVARLDGDEFGLLVPGYTDRNEVTQLAERILAQLAQPINVDGQMVHISASIGVACNSTPLNAPPRTVSVCRSCPGAVQAAGQKHLAVVQRSQSRAPPAQREHEA